MKKLLLIVCIALGIGLNACQSSENSSSDFVPTAVQTTFYKFFPNSNGVKWEKTESGYNAKFKHEGHTVRAKFKNDGAMEDFG